MARNFPHGRRVSVHNICLLSITKIHKVEPVIQVFALAVTLVKETIIDSPPKQSQCFTKVFYTSRELFQSKLHVLY